MGSAPQAADSKRAQHTPYRPAFAHCCSDHHESTSPRAQAVILECVRSVRLDMLEKDMLCAQDQGTGECSYSLYQRRTRTSEQTGSARVEPSAGTESATISRIVRLTHGAALTSASVLGSGLSASRNASGSSARTDGSNAGSKPPGAASTSASVIGMIAKASDNIALARTSPEWPLAAGPELPRAVCGGPSRPSCGPRGRERHFTARDARPNARRLSTHDRLSR
jgi:hypothetical protein